MDETCPRAAWLLLNLSRTPARSIYAPGSPSVTVRSPAHLGWESGRLCPYAGIKPNGSDPKRPEPRQPDSNHSGRTGHRGSETENPCALRPLAVPPLFLFVSIPALTVPTGCPHAVGSGYQGSNPAHLDNPSTPCLIHGRTRRESVSLYR